ncbi:hypothetical protein DAKH74_043500 [Maudiozyma humilis]|uniref:Kinesin motor domain-containing protein n=1 Tax=Maudiozyma humilis TaxID=51915 RepID=A0AAV5S1J8_MAUHU|nr:hypothetical protein DAKH74_043500 [Kazachstania humilis]
MSRVYMRLNEPSSSGAAMDSNAITFQSVLGEEPRTFHADKILDERALRPQLLELLVQPLCDALAHGVTSTVLLYGQDRALADSTLFKHLVPAISGALRDSSALISVKYIEGEAEVPVETLEDVLALRSDTACNRCVRLQCRYVDVQSDTVVSGEINIVTLDSTSGEDICATHRGGGAVAHFLHESLRPDAQLYLVLHCLITPINQTEVLAVLDTAERFRGAWQGSTTYDVAPLDGEGKVESTRSAHRCLQDVYAAETAALEDEVQQYKRVNTGVYGPDAQDKQMRKLELSMEVNDKMRVQVGKLAHLLGDAHNSDVLAAYLDKAVAYHLLLDDTLTVTAQNETLRVAEQAADRRRDTLTHNCKEMDRLLKRQSEQLLALQQRNVDLKIELKEVAEMSRALEAQAAGSCRRANSIVSPTSLFSSPGRHSHKNSVSSTASSMTSDTESTAHSKLSHGSLGLKPGFQLNVLRTK